MLALTFVTQHTDTLRMPRSSAASRRAPDESDAPMVTLGHRPRTFVATLVAALTAAALNAPSASAADGLVLHYPLTETDGTVAADTSGGGRNATVIGDATRGGAEGLQLGGVDGHVKLPDDVLRGLTEVSVSIQVRIAPDQATPYFIYGMGNSSGTVGNGYLFTTGN